MPSESTLAIFLSMKWAEEDGDGINMIIIDERRQRIKEQMSAALAAASPAAHDESGNTYFDKRILEKLWSQVAAQNQMH